MEYSFVKYPKSIRIMAEEIKRATNDYDGRKIGNDELQGIIRWYADKCGDRFFSGRYDYNPTLKLIIGQRRIKVIDQILDGYQLTMFDGIK